MSLAKIDPRVPVNRFDGRPEVYDNLPDDISSGCVACQQIPSRKGSKYGKGNIFMCSPLDSSDGQAHMVCLEHLPENVVIYDVKTKTCRNKSGDTTWMEKDAPGVKIPTF